jgi:hypothetical protein
MHPMISHLSASNKTEPLTFTHHAEFILAVHKELDFWEVYAVQVDFFAGKTFGWLIADSTGVHGSSAFF